jgi:ferredoxin
VVNSVCLSPRVFKNAVLSVERARSTEIDEDERLLPPTMVLTTLAAALLLSAEGLIVPQRPLVHAASRATSPTMLFGGLFGGGNKDSGSGGAGLSARDADFARRQDKLAARQEKAKELPAGSVECTFPQKGDKVVIAKQGDNIAQVCSKAGLRVKFDCKSGQCGTCQVRLNGRSSIKVCQGGVIPGGATRKLKITLDNP